MALAKKSTLYIVFRYLCTLDLKLERKVSSNIWTWRDPYHWHIVTATVVELLHFYPYIWVLIGYFQGVLVTWMWTRLTSPTDVRHICVTVMIFSNRVLPLRSLENLKGTRTKALTGACSTPDAYDDLNPQFSRIGRSFRIMFWAHTGTGWLPFGRCRWRPIRLVIVMLFGDFRRS